MRLVGVRNINPYFIDDNKELTGRFILRCFNTLNGIEALHNENSYIVDVLWYIELDDIAFKNGIVRDVHGSIDAPYSYRVPSVDSEQVFIKPDAEDSYYVLIRNDELCYECRFLDVTRNILSSWQNFDTMFGGLR